MAVGDPPSFNHTYLHYISAASVLNNQIYYCGGLYKSHRYFYIMGLSSVLKLLIMIFLFRYSCYKNSNGAWKEIDSLKIGRSKHTMNTVGTHIVVAGGDRCDIFT